jgi:hypothetical protein
MRILHVDSGREMRGGQWQVLFLHRALIEAGHESLLLARRGGPLLAHASQRGLPCEELGPLRLASRSRDFDLVHAHDARSHAMGAMLPAIPLVVSRRVAFPIRDSAASKWKYARARRFLAVSRFVAGKLTDAGIDARRIDVVYDGVQVPETLATGEAVITPYTLDPAKGMALAQQAAALAGVPLLCSTDLTRDLPQARVLVYISQSEGLGSGILLAMAYGVTVVASRTGGIPEVIEDGVTGYLAPNEPSAIAAALGDALKPPAAERGRAAREMVLRRFTIEHMVNATLESYQKTLHD